MGRPRNGEPYLKGGIYHVRFKGDTMSTDLGTKSMGVAKSRVNEVVRMRSRMGQPSVASTVPTVKPFEASPGPITSAGPNVPGFSTEGQFGPLDDWYKGDSEFTVPESAGGTTPQASSGSAPNTSVISAPSQPANGATGIAKIDWEASPGTASLSSDEKLRLHGLLASVVGRVNVLGVGLGVRIFGRIPAEPEAADVELLNKAWALQLNELFADKEIKPAILIAAASVGLGVGMYVNGEPKPPKVPVGQ